MNPERKSELQRLAEMSVGDIGHNENNVKYRFIIPFLESFGYNKNLDFEHSAQGNRIDILIDRVSDHTILIEAKSYGKNMDNYIPQLKRYCDEKRPILAIISNGEEIRFYSPFWRKANFTETLIFSIARHQLKDDGTIEKIERFLGKEFLEKDEDGRIRIAEHIEEREKEIDNIKEEIQCLSSTYQEKIEKLTTRISNLEEQYESIQSQIDANKAEIGDLKQEKKQKIQALKKQHFVYFSQSKQTTPTTGTGLQPSGTNTKKPLGRKGHEKFRDYLIPVIKLMKSGVTHTEAFKQRVKELGDVRYQTVSAQCTKNNGISTDKFVELVKSNKIKPFLKERYPNKASLIEQEL
ncbi:MAG: hypothetical protein WBC22_07960 [Sedimentisphaerales bacterium]